MIALQSREKISRPTSGHRLLYPVAARRDPRFRQPTIVFYDNGDLIPVQGSGPRAHSPPTPAPLTARP